MATAVLELECPACTTLLELDVGFAGGVCRCSECGTLMTVPGDDTQQVEQLVRPERPDAPGRPAPPQRAPEPEPRRPAAPPTGRERPEGPPRREPEPEPERPQRRRQPTPEPAAQTPARTPSKKHRPSPSKPEAGGPPKTAPPPRRVEREVTKKAPAPEKEVRQAEKADFGTWVTASGRTIEINEQTRIAIAHERKLAIARWSTRVVVIGVCVVILAVIIGIGVSMMGDGKEKPGDPAIVAFAYDRDQNPYTLDKPNVLGVALGGKKTAVIVDPSEIDDAETLQQIKAAVSAGLGRSGSPVRVALFYAGDTPARVAGFDRVDDLSRSSLESKQERIEPTGTPNMVAALDAAMEDEPTDLRVVIARPVRGDEAEAWAGAIGDAQLYIIQVGLFSPGDLRDVALDSGGGYVELSPRQLREWYEAR